MRRCKNRCPRNRGLPHGRLSDGPPGNQRFFRCHRPGPGSFRLRCPARMLQILPFFSLRDPQNSHRFHSPPADGKGPAAGHLTAGRFQPRTGPPPGQWRLSLRSSWLPAPRHRSRSGKESRRLPGAGQPRLFPPDPSHADADALFRFHHPARGCGSQPPRCRIF